MWVQTVGGAAKLLAGGVGAFEGLDLLADATLSPDNALRGAMDDVTGSLLSKALVGLVSGLDKMMGGHFFGKMMADLLEKMMPDLLPPDQVAKLRGTTANEEWSKNYMRGFAEFNEFNDGVKVAQMAKIARDQGFTGTELNGHSSANDLEVVQLAQFAAKNMETTSSGQFHFLVQKFRDAHAPSMEAFMQDQKNAGMGFDSEGIAHSLGYRTESEIASGDVAPKTTIPPAVSARSSAPPAPPAPAARTTDPAAPAADTNAPAADSTADRTAPTDAGHLSYPEPVSGQTAPETKAAPVAAARGINTPLSTVKGADAPNVAAPPVQETIPINATLAQKGHVKHHVKNGIDQVQRTDKYNTPARGNHNVLKVTSIAAVDLKTHEQVGYQLNVGNTVVRQTGVFAQDADKDKKADAPTVASTDKKATSGNRHPTLTVGIVIPKPF